MTTDDSSISTQMAKDLADSLYSCEKHPLFSPKYGAPMTNKAETKAVLNALLNGIRPASANVAGYGPLLLSDIPDSAKESKVVVVGVDEAGRGSVLGPMVYGAAYWSASVEEKIPKGFNDSKQLTEQTRDKLFDQLLDHEDIGFCMRSLLPSEISRNMLRSKPYNLNEMSHDSTMLMIRKLLDAGLKVKKAFIDTVGNAYTYRRKLEGQFPGIEFVVESKADAKYASCSAASVVAKVSRDKFMSGWKFTDELQDVSRDFGSGYPSDPKCKAWFEKLQDPLFGYNDFVRFSWAPIKKKIAESDEEAAVNVLFQADLDDDENDLKQEQQGMSSFLSGSKKHKRARYFEQRTLSVVTSLSS
ncbi:unnamed protein product [Cylindrotheca closterium]|uniref:Ribonuclease n=1 Tax=Cylindrotheca closterium TaxID=2856 RepID=A0AAD2FVV3_9STRA|nr:unnamed protein product [Cylindrotheca closterium]